MSDFLFVLGCNSCWQYVLGFVYVISISVASYTYVTLTEDAPPAPSPLLFCTCWAVIRINSQSDSMCWASCTWSVWYVASLPWLKMHPCPPLLFCTCWAMIRVYSQSDSTCWASCTWYQSDIHMYYVTTKSSCTVYCNFHSNFGVQNGTPESGNKKKGRGKSKSCVANISSLLPVEPWIVRKLSVAVDMLLVDKCQMRLVKTRTSCIKIWKTFIMNGITVNTPTPISRSADKNLSKRWKNTIKRLNSFKQKRCKHRVGIEEIRTFYRNEAYGTSRSGRIVKKAMSTSDAAKEIMMMLGYEELQKRSAMWWFLALIKIIVAYNSCHTL